MWGARFGDNRRRLKTFHAPQLGLLRSSRFPTPSSNNVFANNPKKARHSTSCLTFNQKLYLHGKGDGEPSITDLGITESGITESGITWEIGIRYNGTWYNRISYNIKVECGITESSITEIGIT